MAGSSDDITLVLQAVEEGEQSSERLLPMVYEELRKLAHARMANERAGHTLQATALVHEAWLRLAGSGEQEWSNKAHFFAAAAEAMRRVLIDRGRSKQAVRHGGGWKRIGFEFIDRPAEAPDDTLMLVSEAVDALATEDPKAAEFVKLRFFAGLTVEEASLALGVTDRTGRRYWRFARVWLFEQLNREGGLPSEESSKP
jgi:RNA polymerase sigma factor (TIGR02999 family)